MKIHVQNLMDKQSAMQYFQSLFDLPGVPANLDDCFDSLMEVQEKHTLFLKEEDLYAAAKHSYTKKCIEMLIDACKENPNLNLILQENSEEPLQS